MTNHAREQRSIPNHDARAAAFAQAAGALAQEVAKRVVGKDNVIRAIAACYVAGGHVLLEDRPGVGKSTLSKAFAMALGLNFKRIQMTADLLPVDVLGGLLPVPHATPGTFAFRPGPIFAPIVFLDELNRASARTQSALLEAMEERSVTSDGVTHPLPAPFFVIATQNPLDHAGTSPLPDSQLDRFLIKLSLGLPSRESERLLLQGTHLGLGALSLRVTGQPQTAPRNTGWEAPEISPGAGHDVGSVAPSPTGHFLAEEGARLLNDVVLAPSVLEYILDLIDFTRAHCGPGLSPRAALGLVKIVKANALLEGRTYVIPDDVKAMFPAVARHRLRLTPENALSLPTAQQDPGSWVLQKVPIRL